MRVDEVLSKEVEPVYWVDVSVPQPELDLLENEGSAYMIDYYGTQQGAN